MGTVVEEDTFTLTPYKKGQRFSHPYWGEIMFETSTMKMARDKIPVTIDHKTDRGVGYASTMTVDDEVSLSGVFVKNEHSDYVKSFKGADVMETSFQFDQSLTEFVYLDEGEFRTVDGEEVEGPLVVFRNGVIIEVAFTLLGAVPQTSTSFSKPSFQSKENPMADKAPNEAEVIASAKTQMQAQFTRMNEMCADKEFVATCFSQGMNIDDFSVKVIEKQNQEIAQFTARIIELENEVETLKTASTQDGVSFSAGEGASGEGAGDKKPTYMDRVNKFCADGVKRSQAFIKAAREFPEEYAEFRKSL